MASDINTISASLDALDQQYESITSNIANASLVGYKRHLSRFEQTLQSQSGMSVTSPIDFSQGSFIQTGRPLDLAIDGSGFFTVESPSGKLYTRDGTFTLNSEGQLVDTLGQLIAGENGPLTVPKNTDVSQVTIGADGSVNASGRNIGKIKIVDFQDKSVLKPYGDTNFTASDSAEPSTLSPDKFHITQGVQEGSNVNTVKELVGLITVSRMYEANLKTIGKQDDRLQSLMQVAMA
jgi:flagellar basal-body rod protein FlgF